MYVTWETKYCDRFFTDEIGRRKFPWWIFRIHYLKANKNYMRLKRERTSNNRWIRFGWINMFWDKKLIVNINSFVTQILVSIISSWLRLTFLKFGFRQSIDSTIGLLPPLKIENPLKNVRLSWNFQELVVLVKKRLRRYLVCLSHDPFMTSRRNPKALVLRERESSVQFQIKADTFVQLIKKSTPPPS